MSGWLEIVAPAAFILGIITGCLIGSSWARGRHTLDVILAEFSEERAGSGEEGAP